MAGPRPEYRPGRWASASDLAEYAYCPRAWYYRHHPPGSGPSAPSRARSATGEAFHARTLARVARREANLGVWAAALVGSGLVLAVLVAGLALGWWGA